MKTLLLTAALALSALAGCIAEPQPPVDPSEDTGRVESATEPPLVAIPTEAGIAIPFCSHGIVSTYEPNVTSCKAQGWGVDPDCGIYQDTDAGRRWWTFFADASCPESK